MINYNKPVMQLVWDQINRDNPQLKKPLNATNVALLQGPLTNALRDGRNSRIVVNGLQGGGYSGKMDIYYDRLNLSQYFKGVSVPVKVPYRATTYRDNIDRISAACGLVLTADDLTYPDSQFAMITVATGDRTVAIKSDNPAFTGYIPISFIREEPSFADLYHITETGAWEPMDVYSTVYRLDWSMYTQQIINIPMGTPLRLNSNSYMTQFIAALSAWSGIPFTIGNAATDNPYDLYGYVATRNNNPGLDPDMRGGYNYCVKLTPPEVVVVRVWSTLCLRTHQRTELTQSTLAIPSVAKSPSKTTAPSPVVGVGATTMRLAPPRSVELVVRLSGQARRCPAAPITVTA